MVSGGLGGEDRAGDLCAREGSWATALLWRLGGSSRASAAVLVMLCAAVFLPGFFTIPVVDRDEARFAQASRQMFEAAALPEADRDPARHGGGWVVPMVQDRPRLNKPPLIYWLQAGSAWVLTGGEPRRDAIWMYRVPSLVAGVVAVLGTWWIGRSMFDGRVGVLSGAMLAVCPVVAWEAHQARADMVLLACVVVGMGALWRVWGVWEGHEGTEARRHEGGGVERGQGIGSSGPRDIEGLGVAVVFWGAVGLGVLVKGPIAPMVAGLAVLSLCVVTGRWGWLWRLRPVLGVAIVAAMVAPWVVMAARRVGWDEYVRVVVDETLGRSVIAKEGHWGPPGYHLLLLAVLFWPGSLLTGAGFVAAWRRVFGLGESGRGRAGLLGWWRRRGDAWASSPALLFCVAWIVPSWIVFELVGTKLPHYTMVLYPAVALVSAWAVVAAEGRRGASGGAGLFIWAAIGLGLCVLWAALGGLGIWGAVAGEATSLVGLGLSGVVVACAVGAGVLVRGAARRVRAGECVNGQSLGIGAAVVLVAAAMSLVMPVALGLSSSVAGLVAAVDPGDDRPFATVGYSEDSLVFLRRGRVEKIAADDVEAWVREHPRGLLLARKWQKGLETTPSEVVVGYFVGLNISRGRLEHLQLIDIGALLAWREAMGGLEEDSR